MIAEPFSEAVVRDHLKDHAVTAPTFSRKRSPQVVVHQTSGLNYSGALGPPRSHVLAESAVDVYHLAADVRGQG